MGNIDLRSYEKTLGELINRASHPQKPLTEIGILMVSLMQENIRLQASPDPWIQSARAKRQGGQTLRDTGTLMTGLVSEVGDLSVAAGPTMVGKNHITDPRVFKLLAFGGDVTRQSRGLKFRPGKKPKLGSFTAHYPERNYTYIPPESGKTFGEILQNYLIN